MSKNPKEQYDSSIELLKEHSNSNIGIGTDENTIKNLEISLDYKIPLEFRTYLLQIGYAEIHGDEIPDTTSCLGLHWVNQRNPLLKKGYLLFFNNDLDGEFYLDFEGTVYLNDTNNKFANSFSNFLLKLLND